MNTVKATKKFKIIYAGTPAFAVPPLEAMIEAGHEVVLVVTQPDRVNARGGKISISPIKETALRFGLPLFQPSKINTEESLQQLRKYACDYLITAAYGQILKEEVLAIPQKGCVNIHASLLPLLRGAAPIHRAVMSGMAQSGITIMEMDKGMDTGDILLQQAVDILPEMNSGQLHDCLSQLGAEMIVAFLKNAERLWQSKQKQDDALASAAPKIQKEELFLDFKNETEVLYNKIRGLSPVPVARCMLDGKVLKVYESQMAEETGFAKAGEIIAFDAKNGFVVKTADGALRLKRVQIEGKKQLSDTQFVIGYNIKESMVK